MDFRSNLLGKWEENKSLKSLTWLKLGGEAEFYYEPQNIQDLQYFMKHNQLPVFVLGGGSNTLVRDGGVRGVIIHLGHTFANEKIEGNEMTFGAGCASRKVAMTAAKNNLKGVEHLYTIPGSLGGAVRMNAGCYGGETADHLVSLKIVTEEGTLKELSKADCDFSYRHSNLPTGSIVLEATFEGIPTDGKELLKKMKETQEKRNAAQPFAQSTAGSTFKNPEGHASGKLIEDSGLKGAKIGGVSVSEKHANFFINDGTGTAQNFEDLIALVQKKVYDEFKIKIEPEVKFIGEK